MNVALVRVPLTLATAFAFHVSLSPPSSLKSCPPNDRRTISATASFITATLTKGLFWASALTDTFIVLAPHIPTKLHTLTSISIPSTGTLLAWITSPTRWAPGLGLRLPTRLSFPIFPPLSLATIAGTTLVIAGAYMRSAAFHALGQFYTCPNQGPGSCARHAHALITTGPYGFVRHPGYAGLALCSAGLVVLELDALKAGGIVSWGGSERVGMSVAMRAVALVCSLLATGGALQRIRDEETSLRARFKGEWEAWVRNVPYRLVPGVY